MRKIFLSITVFLLACIPVFAAEISAIEIEGLHKTKQSYVQSLLSQFIGCDSEKLDVKKVETVLRQENIFSDISVEITDDSVISVKVKEKWSLIPFPFFSFSGDNVSGGLVLMDTNAFGVRDNLVTGGIFGNDNITAMLIFSKPSLNRGLGLSSSAFFHRSEAKIETLSGRTLSETKYTKLDLSAGLSEKINDISYSAGIKYTGCFFDDNKHENINIVSLVPQVSFRLSDWSGYFINEKSVQIAGEAGYQFDEDMVYSVSAKTMYQFSPVDKLRLSVGANAVLQFNRDTLLQAGKSSADSNLLVSDFHTDRIFSGNFEAEFIVFCSGAVNFSLFADYQAVCVKDYDDDFEFFHGPGGGCKVYMNKIAIPACSFGMFYNIPQNECRFAFSLGASF